MDRQLPVLLSLFLSSAALAQAPETIPVVFILDEVLDKQTRLFDRDLWDRAGTASDGALLETVLFAEPDAIERARIVATQGGEKPNIVLLSTINAPEKDSRSFRTSVAQVEELLGYQDDLEKWPRKIDLPLCKLYQQRPNEGDTVPASILLVLDDPNARLVCYQLVMAYYSGVPGIDGELVEPIYVDGQAVVAQTTMPPINIHSAFLALKDSRDESGRYQERPSNVYAPNEEIFLRAYLDNVGRAQAGTMDATYQIDLTMELRDVDGGVLTKTKLHSYEGKSTLIFPMDETYFYNNITAGVSLPAPGSYVIAFLFKDATRSELPPAEAVFHVIIE